MYAGSDDIFDLSLGGQIGVECIWDDFVFGIDFRPLYMLIVGDSFRYTIGLSARYRIWACDLERIVSGGHNGVGNSQNLSQRREKRKIW